MIFMDDKYWIYIVRSSKGTLYTGITSDLEKRMLMHQSGKGAKYLRGFKMSSVAALWRSAGGRGMAQRVESIIKKLKKEEKESIIEKNSLLKVIVKSAGLELKISIAGKKLIEINRTLGNKKG